MKPEIKSLLDKANDSYQAALVLRDKGFPDFAASRADFAMFYAAQGLLFSRGLSFSSHSAVISAFGKEFACTGVLDPALHRHFIDAQDYRNQGDYGIGPVVSSEQLQELLDWTEEFISAAREYLG